MTREAGAKVNPMVAELTIFTKADRPLSRGGTRCVYTLPSATDPIVGLGVNVAGPCACGSRKTTITTERRLRCAQCGADRGGLGPRAQKFIADIANEFGAPTEITFRRPLGDVESTDLIGSARTGRLTTDWRTRRRRPGR